ncbi:fluoride efflux transporter CrcB [Chryseosolibacter indicus]|uniref:Fluoride-specific ion channel FluC n=1 Tax=Chryseosolibacter indicus TaxID=2782351 RepID=A0ABS5VQV4_9BACT|nr:fluoride efflux transporter CrcB [Chryseosolibacter indicus]MBT1703827.1 fluoride efflux transporter CrcB [Chryseosolibacter indicus]
MTIYSILIVGAGGFLGTIARYVSVVFIDSKIKSLLPYGTLLVNILGSFVLGFVIGLLLKTEGQQSWRLFLTTGFCGGFTTFSTFAYENTNLIQQKMIVVSITYVAVTLLLGILAVVAGLLTSKLFN